MTSPDFYDATRHILYGVDASANTPLPLPTQPTLDDLTPDEQVFYNELQSFLDGILRGPPITPAPNIHFPYGTTHSITGFHAPETHSFLTDAPLGPLRQFLIK